MSLPSRLHAPLYPPPLALRHQHSPTGNRGGCACNLHVQPLLETLHVYHTHVLRTLPTGTEAPEVQNPWHTKIAWRCNRPTFDHVSSNPTVWRYDRAFYQWPSHGEIRRRMTLFRLDMMLRYSFKRRVIYKTSLVVREPRPFVITRFKTVVPTSLGCFRRRKIWPRGCQFGFANSPTAQITFSSVTSRFHQVTLNAVLPYGISSPSFINTIAASKVRIFLKKKKKISRFLCIVGLFCIFINGI